MRTEPYERALKCTGMVFHSSARNSSLFLLAFFPVPAAGTRSLFDLLRLCPCHASCQKNMTWYISKRLVTSSRNLHEKGSRHIFLVRTHVLLLCPADGALKNTFTQNNAA